MAGAAEAFWKVPGPDRIVKDAGGVLAQVTGARTGRRAAGSGFGHPDYR